jgi:hypothetical protein
MSQLDLPLERPADPRDTEFLVSESNARVIQQLEHWGSWPVMAALLVGPRKSGRTLLARIFAGKTGGQVIDDAERAKETEIFHAWNRAQAEHRPLLIVADAPPPEWEIRLPDLRSRMAATPVLRIGPPDDALIPSLLKLHLDRRLVLVTPELLAWLEKRVERDHVALIRVADVLESEAHRGRKAKLSINRARSALHDAGLLVESGADV